MHVYIDLTFNTTEKFLLSSLSHYMHIVARFLWNSFPINNDPGGGKLSFIELQEIKVLRLQTFFF